jgi:hypothetical protein
MQTVRFISQVENSVGALGYSVLQEGFLDGPPVRMTVLYLRNGEGWAEKAIITPAEKLEGLI